MSVSSLGRVDQPAERPLRRDAVENRDRLLSAARELFAARGLDVTLNDIAHHAGVGVGTAYRRFANKGEVMDALFEEQVAELAEITDRALSHPDPWQGMVYYLEQSMSLQASDKGLAQFLSEQRWGWSHPPSWADTMINNYPDHRVLTVVQPNCRGHHPIAGRGLRPARRPGRGPR